MRIPRIVLSGPTASGKGSVAFVLAQRLGAVIASVDSMKIYREMDIVTAKPTKECRAQCDYRLVDIVEPHEEFSVGEYVQRLQAVLDEADATDRPVILCGGAALYLQAYGRGLADVPGADWGIRERLRAEARSAGLDVLYERVKEVDPLAAEKILPEDERRIVRVLEVFEMSGRRLSDDWEWGKSAPLDDSRYFGLEWERSELYGRTNGRVDGMVEAGLFDEAARLLQRNPPLGRTARQCIGVKEIREGRETGASTEEIIETIQKNTRNFVKRQMTWFRKMPIEWIAATGELDSTGVAEEILRRLA